MELSHIISLLPFSLYIKMELSYNISLLPFHWYIKMDLSYNISLLPSPLVHLDGSVPYHFTVSWEYELICHMPDMNIKIQ